MDEITKKVYRNILYYLYQLRLYGYTSKTDTIIILSYIEKVLTDVNIKNNNYITKEDFNIIQSTLYTITGTALKDNIINYY